LGDFFVLLFICSEGKYEDEGNNCVSATENDTSIHMMNINLITYKVSLLCPLKDTNYTPEAPVSFVTRLGGKTSLKKLQSSNI